MASPWLLLPIPSPARVCSIISLMPLYPQLPAEACLTPLNILLYLFQVARVEVEGSPYRYLSPSML